MRNFWQEVFSENPMMVRALKPLRGLKNWKEMPSTTWVVVGLVALVYVVLVGSSLKVAEIFDSGVFLFVMLTVTILVCATVLHPSLAGEREKRTLDLLLCAPLTARQIVVGKVFKAVIPTLSVMAFCIVPSIVLAIARHAIDLNPTSANSFYPLAAALCLVLTFSTGVFVAGVTLYLSSINRTTANAMIATLGALFLWFIVAPVFAGTVSAFNKEFSDFSVSYHPFYAMAKILYPDTSGVGMWPYFLISTIPSLLIGVLALGGTARNLEKERRTGARVHA